MAIKFYGEEYDQVTYKVNIKIAATIHLVLIGRCGFHFSTLLSKYYFWRMNDITIRNIQQPDNPFIATIIRDTLAEFGANKPGTVYYDPSTDSLYQLFQKQGAAYFIALLNNEIVGGGGIYPTDGLPVDTCELVKMYLVPKARGMGLGRTIIEKSLDFAKETGYKNIYLETMPELKQAQKVYAKFGFEYLNGPMGSSGHTGCSLWMLKRFEPDSYRV
ncbi:MAG: GNAT family N-acetyltransferase [Chitinophagaceae bacterium]